MKSGKRRGRRGEGERKGSGKEEEGSDGRERREEVTPIILA